MTSFELQAATGHPAIGQPTTGKDWILANPWAWMIPGVLLCSLAWLFAALGPTDNIGWRIAFVFVGLFLSGIGLAIRLQSPRPAFLQSLGAELRLGIVQVLAGLFALLALAVLAAFFLSLFGSALVTWRPGQLLLLGVISVPILAWGAWTCLLRRQPGAVISAGEESAALLILAALALFASSWGLFQGPRHVLEWDTMRMFFSIFALVALIAAPLMLAPQTLRRVTVSLLLLLHFGGIATAAMTVQPTPWLVTQIWVRIYRPYLEFMYLGNAYRFYAPEPGPASVMWFRVFYEDPHGQPHGVWVKIPDFDDNGWHRHAVSLEAQRFQALVTNLEPVEVHSMYVPDEDGNQVAADFVKRRYDNSPWPAKQKILGVPPKSPKLAVPFHTAPLHFQHRPPTASVKKIIESYARGACRRPHPQHPDWPVRSVKAYRVVHQIPPWQELAQGGDARDPIYYHAYYMGEFDPHGVQKAEADPLLFWLLPTFRKNPTQYEDWCRRHAGDTKWICEIGKNGRRTWVEGPPDPEADPAPETPKIKS